MYYHHHLLHQQFSCSWSFPSRFGFFTLATPNEDEGLFCFGFSIWKSFLFWVLDSKIFLLDFKVLCIFFHAHSPCLDSSPSRDWTHHQMYRFQHFHQPQRQPPKQIEWPGKRYVKNLELEQEDFWIKQPEAEIALFIFIRGWHSKSKKIFPRKRLKVTILMVKMKMVMMLMMIRLMMSPNPFELFKDISKRLLKL